MTLIQQNTDESDVDFYLCFACSTQGLKLGLHVNLKQFWF